MLDPSLKSQSIYMKNILFSCLAATISALAPAPSALAWGPLGHSAIGNAAVAELNPAARAQVMGILHASSAETLATAVAEACFWPDTVRESPDWSWSSPLHYVNIPRSSTRYDRQRDCPDGLCVTEGILKYAAELARPAADRERRWQAFALLCHLVGDLHQPLHAGFRDDRGGNRVEVEYRGERINLHRFWESVLINERLAGTSSGMNPLGRSTGDTTPGNWNPANVVAWTEESHALAAARAYPPTPVIDDAFADASWALIQQQWRKAAARLALILNTVLIDKAGPLH
jgi:hypothetical protein